MVTSWNTSTEGLPEGSRGRKFLKIDPISLRFLKELYQINVLLAFEGHEINLVQTGKLMILKKIQNNYFDTITWLKVKKLTSNSYGMGQPLHKMAKILHEEGKMK